MRIGIAINPVEAVVTSKEIVKLVDKEVIVTANAIKEILIKKGLEAEIVRASDLPAIKSFDCIFNLGESNIGASMTDFEIAEMYEKNNVKYTGATSETLKRCIDKIVTKRMFIETKIPTPAFEVFENVNQPTNLIFPLIIKPAHEDGSIGIATDSVVYTEKALKRKVKEIIDTYKQPALVEEYIDGAEINAAIVGNGRDARVLPLSEIVFTLDENLPKILSFEAKWCPDSDVYKNTVGRCPARVDGPLRKKIERIALRAYQETGCRDYARVDFRVKDDRPYVLEVNPNPGINPEGAGFIRSAKAAGMSPEDIIYRILVTALSRYKMPSGSQGRSRATSTLAAASDATE